MEMERAAQTLGQDIVIPREYDIARHYALEALQKLDGVRIAPGAWNGYGKGSWVHDWNAWIVVKFWNHDHPRMPIDVRVSLYRANPLQFPFEDKDWKVKEIIVVRETGKQFFFTVDNGVISLKG